MALAPDNLDCVFVDFGDLPLCSEDLDGDPPATWVRFHNEIRVCDAVLIAGPEYNRSVPGGLKNAMDTGSRPQDVSVWDGLPVAIVGVSPYKPGGTSAKVRAQRASEHR
jgi:chromate reductase